MKNLNLIRSVAITLLLLATTSARADEPTKPAAEKDAGFKPEQLVGAWKLVSGERQGTAMDKARAGAIFVFTKDTLTGKNKYGEELSWMSYTLETKQNPVALNLTITKGFPGESREAIVEIRDGQLRLCYNLDKKGRPKAFATKADGNNDRLMVFVKSVDPAVTQSEIKAASEQKWNALRDQDSFKFAELVKLKFSRTGPSGKMRDFTGTFPDYTNPKNKLDAVTVSDQQITVYGDTAVETGRATGTKKDQKAPAWDVRYTHTWIKEDGKWSLVSDHQSPAE